MFCVYDQCSQLILQQLFLLIFMLSLQVLEALRHGDSELLGEHPGYISKSPLSSKSDGDTLTTQVVFVFTNSIDRIGAPCSY